MKERAFVFGSEASLVGVLTEPDEPRKDAPILVVANVGLNHHVGPFRLWVDLARQLAKNGLSTLRFDLSGLGDSEPRRGTASDGERALLDFGDALAFLEKKRGARRFILVGLCSGVDPIHRLATVDERIVGAGFVDGYTYPTPRFEAMRAARYVSPARWQRWIRTRNVSRRVTVSERPEIFERQYPPAEEVRNDLERMLARGAKLFFLHTGGFDLYFNHRGQFFDMFGTRFAGKPVEVHYYESADHTFSVVAHRRVLVDRLTCWMMRSFGTR